MPTDCDPWPGNTNAKVFIVLCLLQRRTAP
jgi:hypothetical protein